MEAYEKLEKELEQFTGSPYVVSCSSGTAALHLALETLQLPHGSQIIIPSYTMVACARAAVMANLRPVFVDIRHDNLLIDVSLLEQAHTEHTMAIMPVHIYGRLCNMAAIHKFAKDKGLFVIEDMAEAHGLHPHPDTHAACWSFYKNKIVHGEEGGCITFKRSMYKEKAQQLRSIGMQQLTRNPETRVIGHPYQVAPRGHNYRMSNAHAELIRDSLEDFPQELERRRDIELEGYDEHCPTEWKMPKRQSPWVYDIFLPCMTVQQQLEICLLLNQEYNINARPGFVPMHKLAEFGKCAMISRNYTNGNGASYAARAGESVITLSLSPHLYKGIAFDSQRIYKSIKRVLERHDGVKVGVA